MPHIESQIRNPGLRSNQTLHVIGVISNYVQFHSRYRLFRQWAEEMSKTPNVELHVVEAIYGDRNSECDPVTCGFDFDYHSVRVSSEIWLKENLINIAVKNLLPSDWKYMAWVDCDVHFRNPNWAMQTMQQLQHFNIVQPWQNAVDLDANGGIIQTHKSFGYLCAERIPMSFVNWCKGYEFAHTGFAWACNRYFYENVEKLLDFCIVGAGDHHIAWSCVGRVVESVHGGVCDDYKKAAVMFQDKAARACGGLVGYVPGRLEHNFHGPKTQRQYKDRWSIIIDNHFDPLTDIGYDGQGVMILTGKNKLPIEQDIMRYNRERKEDSIEQY